MNIEIQDLSMTYPNGKAALQDISLRLDSPSLIGLLGPNGAGKSTFMKLLTAALLPTKGKILADGTPLPEGEQKLKSRLGYLPQSFGLYDELTVWQFLDYMAALKAVPSSRQAIDQVIEAVNLTEKTPHQNPHPLRRSASAGGHRPGTAGKSGFSDFRRTHRRTGPGGTGPFPQPVLPDRQRKTGTPLHPYH